MLDYIYYKAFSSNLKDFVHQNSLFKRLHKNGFVIFDMSLETKSLIKEYGTSNIYKVLQNKKLWSRVVKGQENNSDVKDAEFSNIRWSKFFIDISSLKEEFGDGHPILQIILSLQSDLKRLFDIKNNENYSEAITILYSIRSSIDVQGYHVDFDPDIIEMPEKNYPLSCIFALENDTYFRYLCGSHKHHGRIFDDFIHTGEKPMMEKIISLKFGQFIIFHPFLIHSGWFFKNRCNLRIHFYLDNRFIFDRVKQNKDNYNETFFIDIESCRSTIIVDTNKVKNQMKGLLQLKRYKKNYNSNNLKK